jgi:hypothetical protein
MTIRARRAIKHNVSGTEELFQRKLKKNGSGIVAPLSAHWVSGCGGGA